jgi:hypothetical protein
VGDYLYTESDYDAHLSGTVCRYFNYKDYNLSFAGRDWQNIYDFKSWYTVSQGKDPPPTNINAKAGSKFSNQMLVLRYPTIKNPPAQSSKATIIHASFSLILLLLFN